MNLKITEVEFEDVFHWDAPDYCDAFVVRCLIDGEEATEEQLEDINEDGDLKHELLYDYLY